MGLECSGLGHGVIRHPDFADLALLAEAGQRGSHIGGVGVQVGTVDLVQVDHVDPEAPERIVARRAQPFVGAVVGNRRTDAALRGQDQPIAQAGSSGEHPTEQCLDLAEPGAAPVQAVDVGRVDQVHAGIERGLDQLLGGGQVAGRVPPLSVRDRTDITHGTESAGGGANERRHGDTVLTWHPGGAVERRTMSRTGASSVATGSVCSTS